MRVIIGKPSHDQKLITTKEVPIDLKMVDVVNWMNSFPEVFTLASCQGSEDNKEDSPYVLWISLDQAETQELLRKFNGFENTVVSYDFLRNMIIYRTTWPSVERLAENMEFYRG